LTINRTNDLTASVIKQRKKGSYTQYAPANRKSGKESTLQKGQKKRDYNANTTD
jgi:hypothetical protein